MVTCSQIISPGCYFVEGGCLKCQAQTHYSLPHPLSHTRSFITFCGAALEECSVVLQRSAGLICCFWSVCVPAHIVTVWRNKATRELFSQGDLMERLIYSTVFHTILFVPPNAPVCLSQWASLFPFSTVFSSYVPFPVIFKASNLRIKQGDQPSEAGRVEYRARLAEALTE